MGVLPKCISVYHMHAAPIEAQRGRQVRYPQERSEPPYECWDLTLGPLKEQPLSQLSSLFV